MKWMVFIFILVIGFSSAAVAEVILIDDIGSFSGAVLRIKSPITGDIGDKIYASEYLTDVGIVKFEFETSLSEVFLGFVTSKDGMVVEEFSVGPFVVNGSEILVDRREKVEREVIKVEEVIVEEEVAEVPVVEEVVEPIVVEDVMEDSFGDKISGLFLTGKAVFVEDDGLVDLGHSVGVSVFVLILVFLIFIFMIGRRGKKKVDILNEDDKELEYMEKKVKLTEARISRVRRERDKKKRIEETRVKLTKEKKELERLEERERGEAEIIEDV